MYKGWKGLTWENYDKGSKRKKESKVNRSKIFKI